MSDGRSLWLHRAEGRIFLIPDAVELEVGDFELHSLLGKQRVCARKAVEAYEVTAADAEARLSKLFDGMLGDLPSKISSLFDEAKDSPMFPAEPEDVGSGLRFNHVVEMQTKQRVSELAASIDALVETLKKSGVVDAGALDAEKAEAARREKARVRSDALVVLSDVADKYALKDLPKIDCEARLEHCRARCCTLAFSLSTQDLDERKVRWEYGRPYQIARRTDGYCVHNDRLSFSCQVYATRPASCRTYDCRSDKRIWIDFERRIAVP